MNETMGTPDITISEPHPTLSHLFTLSINDGPIVFPLASRSTIDCDNKRLEASQGAYKY